MNTGDICVERLLRVEKLQLPAGSSASSMRRSQSAVEATADSRHKGSWFVISRPGRGKEK